MGESLIPISDEQAKLGQEIVGATRDLGGWLADILGDLPKDLLDLLIGDKVKVKRAENLYRLWEKTRVRLGEQGIEDPGPVNRKLAHPILEAAADENNDELQDLWARLLAAAMNPDQSKQGRLGFIDALKTLDPLDARVLVWIQKQERATGKYNSMAANLGVLRDEVDVSVANLIKANFVDPAGASPDTVVVWGLTPFGREFLRIVLD